MPLKAKMHLNGSIPRRRRVVHITLGLETGGQENLLLEFAKHADRDRFDLCFLLLGSRGGLAKEIEDQGWPVAALGEPPGLRPSITCRAAGFLRRWRAQVVHTHDCKPLIYGVPAAWMARAARVVHTRHYGCLEHISGRQAWLTSVAARLADNYVCVSEHGARAAIQEGVPARRVRTVWNGIDLKRFALAGPNAQGPVVTVARLSAEKDIGTLLRAAAIAVREQSDLRFAIAGEGCCQLDLRKQVGDLGLERQVTFLGAVRDVPRLLATASLFVLPSLTEGISLTLLEAMARGLPVVATRVGGNPEVVLDGKTGLLVPPGDPQTLAQAILELHADPARSRQMGRAGRDRVEQHFDVRGMVAAYEALYVSGAPIRFASRFDATRPAAPANPICALTP